MVLEKYGKPTLQFKLPSSCYNELAYYYQDSKLYFRYVVNHPRIPLSEDCDTTIISSVYLADIGVIDSDEIKNILASDRYIVIKNN